MLNFTPAFLTLTKLSVDNLDFFKGWVFTRPFLMRFHLSNYWLAMVGIFAIFFVYRVL